MNDTQDEFALWFASSILGAANDEIELYEIESIKERAKKSGDLDAAMAYTHNTQPGDFGAEIAGLAISTFCIWVGKKIWAKYLDHLADKTGEALADLTLSQAKNLFQKIWTDKTISIDVKDIEASVREAAVEAHIPAEELEKLIEALTSNEMEEAITP